MELNSTRKVIAVFDFDGTLTTKDTLFDFTRFYYGDVRFYAGMAVILPTLVLHKLGLLSAKKAKESMLTYFFANKNIDKFNEVCVKYVLHINTIINPLAVKKMEWHKQQGHTVVINSASAENWIKPWADSLGFDDVIATRLEVDNDVVTGRIWGRNCNGQEKVSRLKEIFGDIEDYTIYAYGDSLGDKELLAIADYPFHRKFE